MAQKMTESNIDGFLQFVKFSIIPPHRACNLCNLDVTCNLIIYSWSQRRLQTWKLNAYEQNLELCSQIIPRGKLYNSCKVSKENLAFLNKLKIISLGSLLCHLCDDHIIFKVFCCFWIFQTKLHLWLPFRVLVAHHFCKRLEKNSALETDFWRQFRTFWRGTF